MELRLYFALAALIIAPTFAGVARAGSDATSPEAEASVAITKLFKKNHGGSNADRVALFSEQFLGTEFDDAPLGEGARGKYDKNPLFRVDRFDCTTFVETVIALTFSKDLATFKSTLNHIRYRNGKVSFTSRNHFPCADWIPNNAAAGFVTDITTKLAETAGVAVATAKVDKRGWYRALSPKTIRVPGASAKETEKLLAQLHAEGDAVPVQSVSLNYLPLEKIVTRKEVAPTEASRRAKEESEFIAAKKAETAALPESERAKRERDDHNELVNLRMGYLVTDTVFVSEILEQIPSGSILNIVRPNMSIPGTHMNISHQGLVIKKAGKNYFRHVSRTGGERVKDVPIANYIRLCLLSPPIKGIHLLQINETPKELTARPR